MLFTAFFSLFQHTIRASTDGTIEDISCAVGDNVAKGKLLVKLTEIADDSGDSKKV